MKFTPAGNILKQFLTIHTPQHFIWRSLGLCHYPAGP